MNKTAPFLAKQVNLALPLQRPHQFAPTTDLPGRRAWHSIPISIIDILSVFAKMRRKMRGPKMSKDEGSDLENGILE
jgi:hypothetical protein